LVQKLFPPGEFSFIGVFDIGKAELLIRFHARYLEIGTVGKLYRSWGSNHAPKSAAQRNSPYTPAKWIALFPTYHLRYCILRRYRNQPMDMIRHQMAFQNPAFLLAPQFFE